MQTTRSIAVLPEHVASQIAAGEVIERPASVVKELVENAVDSGASQIEIAVSSDCRDIRVADNGCGMMPEDAVLAFQRHATSKLRCAEDLWKLSSLGFRGEALPSIAAISRMTCYTRPYDAPSGTRVDTDNGKMHATETGCAPGTIMEVVDLFYNVPARLKFLKKASTEFGHIHETVQSLAIACPGVSFKLEKEGAVVLRTNGSGDFSRAIVETRLLSQEETCNVNSDTDETLPGLTIRGLIGKPVHFRGDRKGILSIVNNRPVRCPIMYKALDHAYCDLIPKGRYPVAVLLIDMAPDQVDINIHPSKKEIKYSKGNEVYLSVQCALTKALRYSESRYAGDSSYSSSIYPINAVSVGSVRSAADADNLRDFGTSRGGVLYGAKAAETISGVAATHLSAQPGEQLRLGERLTYVPSMGVSEKRNLVEEEVASVGRGAAMQRPYLSTDKRLIGYLHNTYILIETTEGLEIVEQHIAHERVLYERILSQQENKGRLSDDAQRLVISVPLQLTPEQHALLKDHVPLFESLGFEFEWEQNDVVCTQVPLELAHKDYANTVQQLLAELVTCEQANMELEATKSLACQAAIKNGMALSISDILKLLHDWELTERNDTCPHGRPVCLKFSKEKLFQMFHPA